MSNNYCSITAEITETNALLTVKFTGLVWLKSSINEIVNFRVSHIFQESLSEYCRPIILTTIPRSLIVYFYNAFLDYRTTPKYSQSRGSFFGYCFNKAK